MTILELPPQKTMRNKICFILFLLLTSQIVSAQVLDKYGVNAGASYSNQIWQSPSMRDFTGRGTGFKIGFAAFLSGEKKMGKLFSIRPEIGYIQKGYKNTSELYFTDGTGAGVKGQNLILHNLAINLGLKFSPLKTKFSPYLLAGLRGDYRFAYTDIIVTEPATGLTFGLDKYTMENSKKANLGAWFGIGLTYNQILYWEVEFNPSITNSYQDSFTMIKDICWGAKMGVYLDKVFRKTVKE